MADKGNALLGTAPLGRLMAKYCVPCVISLLVATLYNIVDQLFIANADYLGAVGNAANSVVFPLTVAALGLAMLLGDGCCAAVSIALGAQRQDEARRTVGCTVTLLAAAGIVLTAVYLVLAEPILVLFGADVNPETFAMAKEYFFWIALGIPFYMFSQAMNPVIRADGSPRFAMIALVAGALTNVVLDPIFIFACRWGMAGAAIATILGQILSALLMAGYLFRMKTMRLDRDALRVRGSVLRRTAPLGAASFLVQISIVLSMAVVLNMLKKYGALDEIFSQEQYAHIPTAVVGIVMKMFQIVMSVAIGLATGCIPIAGFNLGAEKPERVLALQRRLLWTEAAVGAVASAAFLLLPRCIMGIFGGAQESVYYMDYAVKCIRIFLGASLLSCVNKGAAIFQQAIGNAKAATGLSVLREIVFGVSLPLILPIFMGLDGVLWFMPISDIVTFAVTMAVVAGTVKRLKKG